MMSQIRPAAVAGMFYPDDARELDAVVRRLLNEVVTPEGPVPKAIIAPHAGYVYSGAVAASAYARFRPIADQVRRVVLLGPCHRVPLRGLAISGATAFETPLGPVPVDQAAEAEILALPQVREFGATHAQEHSLEVHLPFLRAVFDEFAIVPLVVGDSGPEEVAEVLERLWGGPETVIVISSDLSHYLDYDAARHLDTATRRAIEALDPSAIGDDQACGRRPIGGLLVLARRRGLTVTTLDLRSSGDTAGDRRRVVGYGAWMFVEPDAANRPHKVSGFAGRDDVDGGPAAAAHQDMLDRHGVTLLHLAAASIDHGLEYGQPLAVTVGDYAEDLREAGACFVTLKRDDALRGCVGSVEAHRPLVADVVDNGYAAAFRDSRFPRLKPDERPGLDLSVSVLSHPAPMEIADEEDLLGQLRPTVDGLIIQEGRHRALFLPQVWESLPEPPTFLAHLKLKAGLPRDHWSPQVKAWRFGAASVSSRDLPPSAGLWR